ncbi:MAG: hypothetical protein JNL58_24630 [Planctomyces sp.]|nr:hypothetical protein [Planctomyces sp.]
MAVESRESWTESELCYAAFRAAFLTTLDSMLRDFLQPEGASNGQNGFLDRIPLLTSSAPHVQLDCLFSTWRKIQDQSELLTTLDCCVYHAAMDTLAELSLSTECQTLKLAWRGPQPIRTGITHWLYSQVRCLQVGMSWESWRATPGMLSPSVQYQFVTRMPGDSLDHDNELSAVGLLLEVVGRWKVNERILRNSDGLLTDNEQGMIRAFFEEHPGLLG